MDGVIVSEENFTEILSHLDKQRTLIVDTETTGLRPYHGDVLFSIIVATEAGKSYYFNFNSYPDRDPLPDECFKALRVFFSQNKVWVFHNAKFDMAMLLNEGIEVGGTIVDVWAMGRLEYNDHFKYGLDAMGERIGERKSTAVEDYISKHKLWEWKEIPGSSRRTKDKRFNEVPFEVIAPYGLRDGVLTSKVYQRCRDSLSRLDIEGPINWPKLHQVATNESTLTRTLFNMERVGIQMDRLYCEEAKDHYQAKIGKVVKEFKALTGHEFTKGSNLFKQVFKDEKWVFTEKGNPQFDAKTLKTFKHPAARIVIEYAEAKKQLEYFDGFLYHMDKDGVIHTEYNQAGTATGRMSSSNPNLQNLTKPDKYEAQVEESEFPVRRAFVPREGYFFAMIDYDQQEYRMMLDIAGANDLIDKVLGGLDVHQATADVAGITRTQAKTVNFAVLYGSGLDTLAQNLGCDREKAREVRDSIFRAAPEVRDFIRGVTRTAETRGFIFNWLGRRSVFDNKNFSYKGPNYLIQGGCADVTKKAMNECDKRLRNMASRQLLQVHDELVFEVSEKEQYIIAELKSIMESVYQYQRLPLTCGVDFSHKSLADKKPWGDLQ